MILCWVGICYLPYLDFERFMWLPELDARRTSQPQVIHLVVKITIRHYKGGFIYLGAQ